MKIMNKLLASASAFAVGLSSSLGATATNQWFTVDLESGYTADGAVAGVSQAGGTWSRLGTTDASTMVSLAGENLATSGHASGNIAKLDTQGDQLTWTPTNSSDKPVVLIDTDVYLVGSDEEPAVNSDGVQTEVFLKNVLDGNGQLSRSVLCAHVKVGGENVWVELENVTITHQSWVKLRIEMNYKTAGQPKVSFWVNDILMEEAGAGTTTQFDVMDASKAKVSSLSFMGTGYIDNFVGQQVEDIVDGPTFGGPQISTDGGTPTSGGGGTIDTTTTTGKVIATFDKTLSGETLQYVQLTGPNGYVRTYRTSNGASAEFDTTALAVGNYDITAYYGNAPTVVPGAYKPVAEAGGETPAAAVVESAGSKVLRVNVKPVSGLYYTLFVRDDDGKLYAGADSVLAYPDDQDDQTLGITLPVPTEPNGVNLIRIYASDEAFCAGDSAPGN